LKFLKKLFVFVGASICSVCTCFAFGYKDADGNYKQNVIILGDSQVGKTEVFKRILNEHLPVAEKIHGELEVILPENDHTILTFWDTCGLYSAIGLDDFYSIISPVPANESSIVIVFDAGSKEGFDSVPKWLKWMNKYVFLYHRKKITVIGNKVDLAMKDGGTAENYYRSQLAKLSCQYYGVDLSLFMTDASCGLGIPEATMHIATTAKEEIDNPPIV
jgi:hypothetical protein